MTDFTHFNEQGRARMVDVGAKAPTLRTALAGAGLPTTPEQIEQRVLSGQFPGYDLSYGSTDA